MSTWQDEVRGALDGLAYGARSALSPSVLQGAAVEIGWLTTHLAMYPLGLVRGAPDLPARLNLAGLGPAGGGGHAPLPRGGGDQHHPGRGSGAAHRLPEAADGDRAAGDLVAEHGVRVARGVGGGRDGPDLVQRHLQLLGDQRGDPGIDALPHLGRRDHQLDRAGRRNADERIGDEPLGGFGGRGEARADDEAAPRQGGGDQEGATRDLAGDGGGEDAHVSGPPRRRA